jgi:hypothetical protein
LSVVALLNSDCLLSVVILVNKEVCVAGLVSVEGGLNNELGVDADLSLFPKSDGVVVKAGLDSSVVSFLSSTF